MSRERVYIYPYIYIFICLPCCVRLPVFRPRHDQTTVRSWVGGTKEEKKKKKPERERERERDRERELVSGLADELCLSCCRVLVAGNCPDEKDVRTNRHAIRQSVSICWSCFFVVVGFLLYFWSISLTIIEGAGVGVDELHCTD